VLTSREPERARRFVVRARHANIAIATNRVMSHTSSDSDQDPAYDRSAFVVPVERVAVQLILSDGSRHDVLMPRGPGQPIAEVFTAKEPFFPAQQAGTMRLYSRAALACVAIDAGMLERVSLVYDDDESSLPEMERAVRVQLLGGVVLEGELRFVKVFGRGRISDVLNEAVVSFELHVGRIVHHIAKVHVLTIDER